ncbi:MAG: phosphate signaling complex protein PhoU [Akkermansiaceae bacterium]|nr:phosphate signaling complex protein PhoU [Akkermansiaceae bacterium]
MDNTHILKDFNEAINSLREEVLAMAGQARHNVERAVQALLERDVELANSVIGDDNEVDDMERRVDRMGMEIMVRFHPMASDLRLVLSSMKISINLERISDHATSIAKRARKMAKNEALPDASIIEPVYALADRLLGDAITAYNEQDAKLALGLHDRDKELNKAYKKVSNELTQRIEDGDDRTDDYLHLIFVVRSLERIGDLSVNVGEDTVFMEAAKDVRHEKDREI